MTADRMSKMDFASIDMYFARFLSNLDGGNEPDSDVLLAAALASRVTRNGHVCLDLAAPQLEEGETDIAMPHLEAWRRRLLEHPAVGLPGQHRPLILDPENRLYLYRYWHYEHELARCIMARAAGWQDDAPAEALKRAFRRYFPPSVPVDRSQAAASVIPCLKRFCVVTGGPGTGKTFTVTRTLSLLMDVFGFRFSRIFLAAPTGKAAARMKESIRAALDHPLMAGSPVCNCMPETFTLHRLLQPVAGTPYFRFNVENPLPADVVVVDEASMVDLALMAKLLNALPENCRLILLGDKDQLASVEAGAVLGDICGDGTPRRYSGRLNRLLDSLAVGCEGTAPEEDGDGLPLADCMVHLETGYRFSEQSALGRVSRAVNQGVFGPAMGFTEASNDSSFVWQTIETPKALFRRLEAHLMQNSAGVFTAETPLAALKQLKRSQILCAVKKGPYGVEALNAAAETIFSRAGLIRISGPWYAGRPIIILQNDYRLGLLNGDIGIIWPPEEGAGDFPVAVFVDTAGELLRIPVYKLPAHETAFAITVHKSQGSEFESILMVLPDAVDTPVLTRELIYTGLTRARRQAAVWGRRSVLQAAVGRRTFRRSGLRAALWASEGEGRSKADTR